MELAHGESSEQFNYTAVDQENAKESQSFNRMLSGRVSTRIPDEHYSRLRSPGEISCPHYSHDSLLAPRPRLPHSEPVRFVLLLTVLFPFTSLSAAVQEHVILCGGPALRKWEDLRNENEQHDRWWGNFIRASTLRMAEIRIRHGSEAKLIWIVYRPGYLSRAHADGKSYPVWIQEQADKRNCQLIWIDSGAQAITAINERPARSIFSFDYFGHSNRYAFMLDYSNDIMAISKAWIHQRDLGRIRKSVFSRGAICQSYGCHTGESMSKVWRRKIGNRLIGANGKTNYSEVGQGRLPYVTGSWVR